MPKIYRAKALDTGEWVYGEWVFLAGGVPCIEVDDGDMNEWVKVDIATSGHSIDLFDSDGIQLFTHDIVYVKHSSGISFLAEVLEIADQIYLREYETGEKSIYSPDYSLKLVCSSDDLESKSPYPF